MAVNLKDYVFSRHLTTCTMLMLMSNIHWEQQIPVHSFPVYPDVHVDMIMNLLLTMFIML